MNEKYIVTGFNYNKDLLKSDLKKSFEKLNWRNYLKKDTKLFVKPNYTVPFYKEGVTTNANVIEAVLEILKDRVSEVYIGESDGGDDSFTANYSLKNHGIPEICKRTGTEMINLSQIERIKISDFINNKKIDVTLPRFLLSIDETISIPVMKVHVMTTVTLSIKNLWGCHPSNLRLLDHKNLSERLALIAKSIHLRFVVVDGIYGLNKHGPMDGEVIKIGAIIVGNNPVATDSICTKLMGFDPKKIHHLLIANKYGLGPIEEKQIVLLNDLSSFQQYFHLEPTFIDKLSSLCFKSNILNKIVSDSIFTQPIYHMLGREARKKINQPGDEI